MQVRMPAAPCCSCQRLAERRQHACIACGGPGEFPLRGNINSHSMHLICKRCRPACFARGHSAAERPSCKSGSGTVLALPGAGAQACPGCRRG
jgi:hypothetical protein